jgi:hypothetical protein
LPKRGSIIYDDKIHPVRENTLRMTMAENDEANPKRDERMHPEKEEQMLSFADIQ